jgi:hypothetical protein
MMMKSKSLTFYRTLKILLWLIQFVKKEFEENQNCIGDEFHQEPDHPSTFMKMVKERTLTMSAVNYEMHQVLPSKVIWDGTIDHFEVFLETMLKVIMDKLVLAIYLIQASRRLN